MLFPLILPLELDMVTLVEFLAGAYAMTVPNLAVVALFVKEAGKFLWT